MTTGLPRKFYFCFFGTVFSSYFECKNNNSIIFLLTSTLKYIHIFFSLFLSFFELVFIAFYSENTNLMFKKIMFNDLMFPPNFSELAQSFVRGVKCSLIDSSLFFYFPKIKSKQCTNSSFYFLFPHFIYSC